MLVIAQIALSLLLLVGAGLFVGSFRKLLTQDMGFHSESVLLVEPDLRGPKYSRERQTLVADELLDKFRAIPGVQAASRSSETPVDGGSWQWDIKVDTPGGERKRVHAYFNLISSGYFQAFSTTLLRGRDFVATDTKDAAQVAIINETAARQYFPGVNPIGQSFYNSAPGARSKQFLVQVIGLAKDAKYLSLREAAPPTVYLPLAQNPSSRPLVGVYELRSVGNPTVLTRAVKEAARTTDPRIGLGLSFMSERVASALAQERLMATLAGFFGLLALILASVGLYGVLAYTVARRRNEIAIRMALGATRTGVLSLVLRDLAGMLLVGMPLGLGAAVACASLVRSMLWGLTPADPATLAGSSALLLFVAAIAGYLPAQRAARLDPVVALREE